MILKKFLKTSALLLTCGLTFVMTQEVFADASPAAQAPSQSHIQPWMQSQIDSTIDDYKKKFPGVWTSDEKKISPMNGTTPKVLELLHQFETEKAPPFRKQIQAIIQDLNATFYITPTVGTGYRSHYIRCLWVKDDKGNAVNPNDPASNSDNLKFLAIYGTNDTSARTPKVAFFTDGKYLYAFEEFYKASEDTAVQKNPKVTPQYQERMDKLFKGFFTSENKYENPLNRVKEGKIAYYMKTVTGSGHGHTSTYNMLSYAMLPSKDFKSISGNLTFKSIQAKDDNIDGPWTATYTDDRGKDFAFEVISNPAGSPTDASDPCPFSAYQAIPKAQAYMKDKTYASGDFYDKAQRVKWRPIKVDHAELNDTKEDIPVFLKKEISGNNCKCIYGTKGKEIGVSFIKIDAMTNRPVA